MEKNCLVCGKRRRHLKEKLCKNCLCYYKKKFGVKNYQELNSCKDFNELIAAYEALEEYDHEDQYNFE